MSGNGETLGWFEFQQKNKPQSNALAGGILTMLITGFQIGWIFNSEIPDFPWARGHSSIEITLTYAAFYFGVIAGLYLAAMIIKRLTKTNIYFSAATFATFGSIGYVAMPKSLYLLLAARFVIGLSHGYAYLTLLVHASEIMTQKLRGMAIAAVNLCVIISIHTLSAFTMALDREKHGWGALQWVGIIGLIYAVLTFTFIGIFTRESPVHLIQQKRFDQAVTLMTRLRNESTTTWKINNEYNELKAMVEEDEQSTQNIFDERNTRPLLLIVLMKVGSVLCFNFGINMIRLRYTEWYFTEDRINYSVMALTGVRMIIAVTTLFTIDTKGRRRHFTLSFGGSAAVMIAMAAVLALTDSHSWMFEMLSIAFEVCGGIGIGMIADIYSAEAFNTMKKPKSILFLGTVECLLQSFLVWLTFGTKTRTFHWIYLGGSGAAVLAITLMLYKKLPETAKMSIRQTRNEFLKAGEIVFSGTKMPAQSITFD